MGGTGFEYPSLTGLGYGPSDVQFTYGCTSAHKSFCPQKKSVDNGHQNEPWFGHPADCVGGNSNNQGNDAQHPHCKDDDLMDPNGGVHTHRTFYMQSGQTSEDYTISYQLNPTSITTGNVIGSLSEMANFCKNFFERITAATTKSDPTYAYCPATKKCVFFQIDEDCDDPKDPCCACSSSSLGLEMPITTEAPYSKVTPSGSYDQPNGLYCKADEDTTTWKVGEEIEESEFRLYNCESSGTYRLEPPPTQKFDWDQHNNGEERQIADISSFPTRRPWFLRWQDCAAATTGHLPGEDTTGPARSDRPATISPTFGVDDVANAVINEFKTMVKIGDNAISLKNSGTAYDFNIQEPHQVKDFYPLICEDTDNDCGSEPFTVHPSRSLIIRGKVNKDNGAMSVIDGEDAGTLFQLGVGGNRLELSNIWLRRGRGWCGGAVLLDSYYLPTSTTSENVSFSK